MFAIASTDPFSQLLGWGIIICFGCYVWWKKAKKAVKHNPDTARFPYAHGGMSGHDFRGVLPAEGNKGGAGVHQGETGIGSEGFQVSPIRKVVPMSHELIAFACEKCSTPLQSGIENRGQLSACPRCNSAVTIPWQGTYPAAVAVSGDPTVPVNMRLPGGAGFIANVSRSDAGKMGFTVLGVLLAIVCLIFGGKWRPRA
jgi:hypothetical protein